jgi:hypothetical protein
MWSQISFVIYKYYKIGFVITNINCIFGAESLGLGNYLFCKIKSDR